MPYLQYRPAFFHPSAGIAGDHGFYPARLYDDWASTPNTKPSVVTQGSCGCLRPASARRHSLSLPFLFGCCSSGCFRNRYSTSGLRAKILLQHDPFTAGHFRVAHEKTDVKRVKEIASFNVAVKDKSQGVKIPVHKGICFLPISGEGIVQAGPDPKEPVLQRLGRCHPRT